MAGAPLGNQNAVKPRIWYQAICRALERRKPNESRTAAIDELAERLLDLCAKGELSALQELGSRLDGKPAQAIIHSGDGEGDPIRVQKVERVLIASNIADKDC